MSRDEMLHVICVPKRGLTATSIFVRPRTCLRDLAALMSTLSPGTTVHVLLDEGRLRVEWRGVSSGRPPAWLVEELRAELA